MRYIVGGAVTIWLVWQLPSLLGIVLSEAIPTAWGLGFAGTLAMLGLTYGLMKDRSTWTAALDCRVKNRLGIRAGVGQHRIRSGSRHIGATSRTERSVCLHHVAKHAQRLWRVSSR